MRFEGKVALVNGGAGGIGSATAIAWLASGEASHVTGETVGVSGGLGMM